MRIACGRIKISHSIECAAVAYELIDRLAPAVDLRGPMGWSAVQTGGDRGACNANSSRVHPRYTFFESGDNSLRGSIRRSEIVDALEPHHSLYSGESEHIAVQAFQRGRAAARRVLF